MTTLDWIVVALYFALTFAVAIVVSRRSRDSAGGYFLAGRNAGWFIVGASLFASNIGAEHLVGLAGTGAASGLAVAQFEIMAGIVLLLLGWFFVPFYVRSGVYTMPEFLERRYSSGPRMYLAVVSVISYVLTKISVTIAAGGIVFEALMGIDFWTGATVVVLATGVYTLFGGLKAVLYTDAMQMFVLLLGAVVVTALGLQAIGGWDALVGAVGPDRFDLWQPSTHPDFPWTGILFGAPILGIWYWCTDQFIVQRVLAARNLVEARRGAIFAGFMKQTPLFLFVLPGVIAYALAQSGRLTLESPDQALPALAAQLLPAGLRGIVVAGLLAALMSSLSSVFNSSATLVTMDLYKRWRPAASERQLVVTGQMATVVLVLFGLAWIPLMKLISSEIYTYLQSVQAYISPPIAAVFLVGLLWPRANAKGAGAALALGFVLGFGRLVLELNSPLAWAPAAAFAEINFLHFAVLLFAASIAVMIAVSLASAAPPPEKTRDLTIATLRQPAPEAQAMERAARRGDIALSVLLVLVVAAIWTIFSG
ncbi:MAG TPA: sodium:solute symporter [Steroidobacteraceae bacterium]|nr:sodium:solute symporter [Steroidobacteraceae bacterium]